MHDSNDPFREMRERCPIHVGEFQGEEIPMILRHKDVREAAKNTPRFSSDSPLRVPIPSEEEVRRVRQLPLELDPPQHAEYRKIVEPFFLRPKTPEFQSNIQALIGSLLHHALRAGRVDVVHEFAIPFQSRALCFLLNVSEDEAALWISWGMHVFKDGDGKSKGFELENYCRKMSALNQAQIQGRSLTMEEKLGYANLAFAGGRDTVIHMVTNIVAHFAHNPLDLARIRAEPEKVNHAAEEFFRVFMPLTHIGRICPVTTDVFGFEVAAMGRVSLCWASANRDAEIFEAPDEIRLDRKPNPHVSFGYGPHLCLGAHHARTIVRGLLRAMAEQVESIDLLESVDLIEREQTYGRKVGFAKLVAKFHGMDHP
jgi:cytochrome P450